MAVTGSLEQIQTKVRRITGRLKTTQLSDADLTDYINDFYEYDMPAEIKHWNLQNNTNPLVGGATNFDLEPGEAYYAEDSLTYPNIAPPFYVGGYLVDYYQDVQSFLSFFPTQKKSEQLSTGTGIAGPYTGTIVNTPILRQSVFISALDNGDNSLTCTDNGAGTFTGDVAAGSTLDYGTGAVAALTFTGVIPAGNEIWAQSLTYSSGRPTAVLYYNQALIFYPVPDKAYEVSCKVNVSPDALGAGDQPVVRDWWNFIAYGAALKIFAEYGDLENYEKYNVLFNKYRTLVQRRTLQQLKTQRVSTIYDNSYVAQPLYPSN